MSIPEYTESADIWLIKIAEPCATIAPGEEMTYGLIIGNRGPATAQKVLLQDLTPINLLDPEFSTDIGAYYEPWPGQLFLGNLPVGKTLAVLIKGKLCADTKSPLINTGHVSSITPDPNMSNNSFTISTPICSE